MSKNGSCHYHQTVFLCTVYHGGGIGPHLLLMRKSLKQKRSGKSCVHVCVFVGIVNPRKPGQGQTRTHKPNTLWLSSFILSTYQYSADHPGLPLSGWGRYGRTVASMPGICPFFPPQLFKVTDLPIFPFPDILLNAFLVSFSTESASIAISHDVFRELLDMLASFTCTPQA